MVDHQTTLAAGTTRHHLPEEITGAGQTTPKVETRIHPGTTGPAKGRPVTPIHLGTTLLQGFYIY